MSNKHGLKFWFGMEVTIYNSGWSYDYRRVGTDSKSSICKHRKNYWDTTLKSNSLGFMVVYVNAIFQAGSNFNAILT